MRLLLTTGVTAVAALCLASCKGNSGSGGTINIVLSKAASRSEVRTGTSCSVSYESTTVLGKCYTPLEVKGIFNKGTLSATGGGAPVRILGGGSDSGLAEVFKQAAFDLDTAPSISGEDNIEDGGGTYNMASLNVQALEYAFVAESTNKVYHVRIPFAATPPSSNSVFSSCGLGGGLTEADTLGTFYAGITAQAGDILVCIKSNTTDSCAIADYQWVDGSGNLSSTRPGSPKQLSGSHLMTADSCTSGADHPELEWGSAKLEMSLGTALSISATNSGGVKTYNSGSNTGTTLNLELAVNTANSIVVPTSLVAADLNAATQSQILNGIDSILPKPIYVNKNKSLAASTSDGMLSATATVTLQ